MLRRNALFVRDMTMNIFLIFSLIIVCLVIALAIAIKVAISRGKKNHELKNVLISVRQELEKQKDYFDKYREAEKNADDKKKNLHTGDDNINFNNSLDVLQNSGGSK